ncbi:hypothetical protein ACQUY5_25745 [Bacillus cereus]|uniref:hypothetical protein n=1 Tax=Bacillus cereus TaxID=1396 RepID=UPI003D17820F
MDKLQVVDESQWSCDLPSDEQEQKALQTLTDMETKVWNYLVDGGWFAEPTFSDVIPSDIEDATKIPMKQLRGVLSSLVQKGLIVLQKEHLDEPFVYRELDFRND